MSSPLCRTTATVRAAALETAAFSRHLLLYPTGLSGRALATARGRGPAAAGPRPGPPPVLLLHGLLDNRAVFTPLRRSLLADGFDHLYAVNYSPLTADVPRAAAEFGRQVVRARQRYGGERIAVVGHSLGGLIARYYVQLLGGSAHVHTLVTLGTPHAGSYSALLLGPLPAARQLLPGSPVIRALQAPAPACDTRFLSLWGDHDPLILPGHSALLLHPDLRAENIRVPGVGHLGLTVHPGSTRCCGSG
ncbi:alpha/beta fold hydrolase [Streptacidiphilus sp. 4-A2]|nr:alpha/beta fold hydrolase [Streptacidiphilus sp. 4-A2]